jgi:hypothetical protein
MTRSTRRGFYSNPVAKNCRSWMNVPFRLAKAGLEKTFLAEAEAAGLANLAGHRAVGGMRASLYNAMPEAGVAALVDFMRDFERRNGLMRFRIRTLNSISQKGLERLPKDRYEVADEIGRPDAILLRSADMHEMDIPASVLAVGRAGAGTNNIPVSLLSQRGVPVFNSPGANANAVKELVLAGLFLGARHIGPALDFVRALELSGDALEAAVEQGKKRFRRARVAGPHARRRRARRNRRGSRKCRAPPRNARARLRPSDHGSASLAAFVRRRAGPESSRTSSSARTP